MKNILFCAHSNYEVFICFSLLSRLNEDKAQVVADLIVPRDIADLMPAEWAAVFRYVHTPIFPRVNHRLLSDFKSAYLFSRFVARLDSTPDVVFVSAWRSSATNILARRFKVTAKFIGAVNGVEPDPSLYTEKPFLKTIHRLLLDRIFGWSELVVRYQKFDQLHAHAVWKQDPMDLLIEFGVGREPAQRPTNANTVMLAPPFVRLENELQASKTLLLVGERTPLFEDLEDSEGSDLQAVVDQVRRGFAGWRLLFRPRPGYTRIEKLNLDGYEVMDGISPLENVIYTLKPGYVISAKSTASKFAWSLNIPSAVFYPLMNLESHHLSILESFFEDCPSLPRITKLNDLLPSNIKFPEALDDASSRQHVEKIFE